MKLNKQPYFVHLNVHSNYSFTRGTADLKSICEAARQRGMRYLALTDTNGFYGLVWFLEAARQENLIPIIGAEISIKNEKAVLLAKSMVGYQNISQILTERHLEPKSFSIVDAVSRYTEDIIVLSPLIEVLEALLPIVPQGQLFAEFQPGKYRGELATFCEKTGLPPVATNNVHFVNPAGFDTHRLLRAIAKNTSLSRLSASEIVSPECWLKPPELMQHAFPDYPEALENSVKIAEQ
ncbi:PHP domain-containing protein, partial [bacterium]|nr:PHP domain-containing protein [bacterium]